METFDTINLGFPIGLDTKIADFIDQITVNYVRENRGLSAQEIRQFVIDDLHQFIGNHKVFDDITLVVLKQK